MKEIAYFNNIKDHILDEIDNAKRSVFIAVAWFTDSDIFDFLCLKAKTGIQVQLIINNDKINIECGIDYNKLIRFGGIFLMIGDNNSKSSIMHNKFCVIDNKVVITGSYNWSRAAKYNDENIIIVYDNIELAKLYINAFESIVKKIYPSRFPLLNDQFYENLTGSEKGIISYYDETDVSFMKDLNMHKEPLIRAESISLSPEKYQSVQKMTRKEQIVELENKLKSYSYMDIPNWWNLKDRFWEKPQSKEHDGNAEIEVQKEYCSIPECNGRIELNGRCNVCNKTLDEGNEIYRNVENNNKQDNSNGTILRDLKVVLLILFSIIVLWIANS